MSLIEKAVAHSKRQREIRNRESGLSALNVTPSSEVHRNEHSMPLTSHPLPESRFTVSRKVDLVSQQLEAQRLRAHLSQDAAANLFAVLATQVISRMDASSYTSLAIVSPTGGVGKSTLAANLAIAIARRENASVLLVDLDLRKPSQASLFGFTAERGIEDYLEASTSLEEVAVGFEQFERLTLIPGATGCSNVEEVLHSRQMSELLQEFKAAPPARVVIYDLPPILGLSDAIALLPKFDSALLVVEEYRTSQAEISETIRLLDKTPLIGYVTNKCESNSGIDYGSRTSKPSTL